jgi:low affinity Fe/Cu permease
MGDGLVLYIGIVTFLMVFLIQRGQNKEISILHLKLNELIAATNQADNSVINADTLSEQEIHEVRDEHRKIGGELI